MELTEAEIHREDRLDRAFDWAVVWFFLCMLCATILAGIPVAKKWMEERCGYRDRRVGLEHTGWYRHPNCDASVEEQECRWGVPTAQSSSGRGVGITSLTQREFIEFTPATFTKLPPRSVAGSPAHCCGCSCRVRDD